MVLCSCLDVFLSLSAYSRPSSQQCRIIQTNSILLSYNAQPQCILTPCLSTVQNYTNKLDTTIIYCSASVHIHALALNSAGEKSHTSTLLPCIAQPQRISNSAQQQNFAATPWRWMCVPFQPMKTQGHVICRNGRIWRTCSCTSASMRSLSAMNSCCFKASIWALHAWTWRNDKQDTSTQLRALRAPRVNRIEHVCVQQK